MNSAEKMYEKSTPAHLSVTQIFRGKSIFRGISRVENSRKKCMYVKWTPAHLSVEMLPTSLAGTLVGVGGPLVVGVDLESILLNRFGPNLPIKPNFVH
jgi:hypothetical protein